MDHPLPSSSERQPLLSPSTSNPQSSPSPPSHPPKSTSDVPLLTPYALLITSERHFLAKVLATNLNFIISGIFLTATGSLIPSIERFYSISDSTLAYIFPCALAGYLCSTVSIQWIHLYSGRRGLAYVSALFRLLPLGVLGMGRGFGCVLVAFFAWGYGSGLTDAGWCAWASGMRYANVVQGLLQGAFGVGAVAGPFVAVGIIKGGNEWFVVYAVLFLAVVVEMGVQGWAFRDDTAAYYKAGMDGDGVGEAEGEGVKPFNPLRFKTTWMCGLFYFVYIAIENCYSDWVVVFMQRVRHVDFPTASLAPSTYWVGMSIGRVGLGPVTEYFGLRMSVTSYILMSTVFQMLFKVISDVGLSLVLLGLNGAVLAPMFPSGLVLLATKLPLRAHVGAVAASAAMGQVGGSIVPLGVGFMADRIGMERLLDVVLGLTGVMLVVWLAYCRFG